jgi:phosphocarrier protein
VSAARGFSSELTIRSGTREVNGKSILELMTLNAAKGVELEVRACGGDAVGLMDALEELFRGGFGELES